VVSYRWKKSRRALGGVGEGGLRDGARIRVGRRVERGLHRVAGQTHELAGDFELAGLRAEAFGLEAERAARPRPELAADGGAHRAAEERAEGAAGDRQRLLGEAFQRAAERLADRAFHDAAERFARGADQAAEKLFELLFARDLEQFGGELHFLLFVEDAS